MKKLICVNTDIEKKPSPGASIYGINAREWPTRYSGQNEGAQR